MVLHQRTTVKPFHLYPLNAAGELVMDDEPEWLRLWGGPLTEEERTIYKKFVPEGVEYFDRAKNIFNVDLRIPLTIFTDKEGAKLSFSQEWDMIVAEHVRAVIASERPSRENEVDDIDDSAGNDSDVSLPRPFLDSSEDFTYTSDEDEEKEEDWLRVQPVAPIHRIYYSDGTLVPPNLTLISLSDMATSSQIRPSATHQLRRLAAHQQHHSAPSQSHYSPPHQPRYSAPHQPRHSAPLQPRHSAPHQRFLEANFSQILFYYHGRTQAFYKTLSRAKNPSKVPGLNRLMIDSSSTTEQGFEVTNHFSFIMGPFVPLLYSCMDDLTEDQVREVFTLLPSVPDMKALVALHESHVLHNTGAGRQLLDLILAANRSGERTIFPQQNPTRAETSSGVSRNFGVVGSRAWTTITESFGSSSSGLDESEDLSFEIPSDILQSQPRHLSSDPKKYTMEDSVRCRAELGIAIRNETLSAAKNLASAKLKVDMVQKLEETSSIELAKQFLKTPEAAFVLHSVYRKPWEQFGIRSVPRHKVLTDSFVSASFVTLETLGESVENGDLDNFFVEYWSAAQETTENHFLAHDETLRALQDVSLNDEADFKIINSHLNCLKKCIPYFAQQLNLHKEMLKMVSCVLMIKEYNIGKRLLEALEKISKFKPPEAFCASYVLSNLLQSVTDDLDEDEEFSE